MAAQSLFRFALSVLVAALLAASMAAAGEAPAPQPADQSTAWTDVTVAGVQVAVDENGRLRQPTAAEVEALTRAFRQQFARPSVATKAWPTLQLRDGHVSTVVALDHLNFSVLSIRPDGSLALSCVDDVDQAVDLLTGTADRPEEE